MSFTHEGAMSGTVVVALPHTSGISQKDAEGALIDLIDRRLRSSCSEIAMKLSELQRQSAVSIAAGATEADVADVLNKIDETMAFVEVKRREISDRLEARTSLVARVDGVPTLELARAG